MSFSRLWLLDPASISIQRFWDPFTGLINQDCLAVWYRSGPWRKTWSIPGASPHRPETPFPPSVLSWALCAFLLPTHGPPLWSQGHWCMEPLDVGLQWGGGLERIYVQARPQVPTLLAFLKVIHPLTWPSGCITHQRSSVSTHRTFQKPVKSGWILLLAGVSVWRPGWLGSSCFLNSSCWELDIGSYPWVPEARAAGSFCFTSQSLEFPLLITSFIGKAHVL